MDIYDLGGVIIIGLLVLGWYLSKGKPTRTKVLVWTMVVLGGGLVSYLTS